jgi:ATP-binding cassette, subfamily B, bacterial
VSVGASMLLSALAAAVALLALNPLLGALVLIVVPLFAVIYQALRARLTEATYARQKLIGELIGAIQENLSAHTVVKAFGMEARSIAAYHGRMERMLRAGLRVYAIGGLFDTSTALAITFGQLIVLGVGGYLVMSGQLTVGTLLAFIGLLAALFTPISSLASTLQTVQSALGALDRIQELLNTPVTIADKPDAPPLPPLAQEIRLEQVVFGYGGDRAVLHGLDLTIPAGMQVAIVGPSGSGKSTILNLLLRFWDPDQGRVYFDQYDLRDVTLESLRGQIAIVFQDTFIFDTTVRENIALARPSATDAEIKEAARAARLDGYIRTLPAGYDTILGERGVRMSGGQRQRLAIARALLRNARILILDEATSALDSRTEREIRETLAQVVRERTVISITHRLSLAEMADRVVVLDQGRVVEQGSHAELMQAGGLYQRLYEEQSGRPTASGRARIPIELVRLLAIPLFAGLSDATMEALAEQLVREEYAGGEDVIRQGELGDRLYLISRGQVEVLVNDGGVERRLNTLKAGEYFGELALLSDAPRSATVRTMLPTQLYSLARPDFVALLEQEPDFWQGLSKVGAQRRAALAEASTAAGLAD